MAILLVCFPRSVVSNAQSSIPLTSCRTITQPGDYEIPPHTTIHASGDCIIVAAAHVTVGTQISGMEGDGTGVGVHFLKTAHDSGFNEYIGAVSGFATCIQDDANNVGIT